MLTPTLGGFCVLKGSHKANFKVPDSIVHGDPTFVDRLYQVTLGFRSSFAMIPEH